MSQRLNHGANAWQLAAATIVGLQSVPGLVVLYGGIVKKKWPINSAFMALYAFAAVLVAWILWGYNMLCVAWLWCDTGGGSSPFGFVPRALTTAARELLEGAGY